MVFLCSAVAGIISVEDPVLHLVSLSFYSYVLHGPHSLHCRHPYSWPYRQPHDSHPWHVAPAYVLWRFLSAVGICPDPAWAGWLALATVFPVPKSLFTVFCSWECLDKSRGVLQFPGRHRLSSCYLYHFFLGLHCVLHRHLQKWCLRPQCFHHYSPVDCHQFDLVEDG